jgi:short-subunit dehydrogenase
MFKNKTYLITGASHGIGKSLAIMLGSLGAEVVLLGSNERALEKTYDEIKAFNQVTPLICTFNLETAVQKDYATLEQTLTEQDICLDGLIHCAGQLKSLTPLEQTPLHQWHRLMQVNLNARFALTHTCLPFLKKSKQSQIIFLLSEKALEKGKAYWGAYQVSEKATLALFEILVDELESTSVKVNVLKAMPVNTKLRKQAYPFEDTAHLIEPEALNDVWLNCLDDNIKHGDIIDACDILNQNASPS